MGLEPGYKGVKQEYPTFGDYCKAVQEHLPALVEEDDFDQVKPFYATNYDPSVAAMVIRGQQVIGRTGR